MFLSDTEIKKEIESGTISIRPILDMASQMGSCSFDLRMGQTLMVFRRFTVSYLDPLSYRTKEAFETKKVPFGEQIIIHPGMDILTTTLEEIRLSSNIVGFVSARSSLIRLGLDMSPAFGRIDPGFQGRIVIRLHNFSGVPIAIIPGMRICSLSFARIYGKVEREYSGKYQKAESYEPRMYLDKDVQFLKILPNGEIDRLIHEQITATALMQQGFRKLSSRLGEAQKRIILKIFESGRTTTPKLASQLNYNKFYLSTTMKELVENAIVQRSIIRGKSGGFYYDLTGVGKALAEYLERERAKAKVFQSSSKPEKQEETARTKDVHILDVNIIPRGSDSSSRLNDEYVLLKNRGKHSINMAGWAILNLTPVGTKLHSYVFPDKLHDESTWQLEQGQGLRLVTGKGNNQLTTKEGEKGDLVFFWNREWFAWWPGDTVLLVDGKENGITRFKIP